MKYIIIPCTHYTLHIVLWFGSYLEVVCCVTVSVLGHMEEDEEVLPEVVSHSRQPGKTVARKAEVHHLGGLSA